jgi:hypothetical protein
MFSERQELKNRMALKAYDSPMGRLPGSRNKKALWAQTIPKGFRSPGKREPDFSYRFPTSSLQKTAKRRVLPPTNYNENKIIPHRRKVNENFRHP